MSDRYRIFGVEASPYSVKVRSYFRYKGIPHAWIVRSMDQMPEFGRYAKLPLVPLVVTPDGQGLQDSTPILEKMETLFPEPSIAAPGLTASFVNLLVEEFADEWVNKPMFHYRWTHPTDQESAAQRVAEELAPANAPSEVALGMVESVKARMVPRLSLVGSTPESAPLIERSFLRLVEIIEVHLTARPYLFGARPVLADFGLFAQLYELASDPTPGELLKRQAPHIMAWLARMLSPESLGELEPWDALAPTLQPLLSEQIAQLFLPWSTENARALVAGEKRFTVTLQGHAMTQEPQRYHAKSLGVLKQHYQRLKNPELDAFLEAAGLLRFFSA